MTGRKRIACDDEIDKYLSNVISNLEKMGIRNPSKQDALRFVIQMNAASNLKFQRAPKKKKTVLFFI